MTTDLIGRTLGPYRVDSLLGEGGFATVYKGYQPDLDRVVAIKVLDERLARHPSFIERFRREAEATFSLQHPHIVRVFDFREAEGLYLMVMEYVDGPTLRQLLQGQGASDARGSEEEVTRLHEEMADDVTVLRQLTARYEPLEVGLVAEVALHLCDALAHAHREGIIHRDVKPDNVLVSPDGRALLGDFGIARVQEEARLTRTGLRVGSAAYMSPEQIVGREVDHRTDIYSMGIVLYEMLTGTTPFVGADTAVWQMHLREEPLPPTALRSNVPKELESVVLQCLEKDVERRFQTAGELAEVIRTVVQPLPLTTLVGLRGGEQRIGEKTEKIVLLCSRCAYAFEMESVGKETRKSLECPACRGKVTQRKARYEWDAARIRAEEFIEKLGLEPGLSLDVRVYEYRRRIQPELERQQAEVLKEWDASMQWGSVVSPVSEPGKRPKKQKLLATVKSLFHLARLWESKAVGEYIVSLEDKRKRRQGLDRLNVRGYMLLGLYHSLLATEGKNHESVVAEYHNAGAWYRQAAEAVTEDERELREACELSVRWCEAMRIYSEKRPDAEKLLLELAEAFGRLKVNFAPESGRRCRELARLYEETIEWIVDLPKAAERIVREGKVAQKGEDILQGLEQIVADARAPLMQMLELSRKKGIDAPAPIIIVAFRHLQVGWASYQCKRAARVAAERGLGKIPELRVGSLRRKVAGELKSLIPKIEHRQYLLEQVLGVALPELPVRTEEARLRLTNLLNTIKRWESLAIEVERALTNTCAILSVENPDDGQLEQSEAWLARLIGQIHSAQWALRVSTATRSGPPMVGWCGPLTPHGPV